MALHSLVVSQQMAGLRLVHAAINTIRTTMRMDGISP
jgi:hypothetical protein